MLRRSILTTLALVTLAVVPAHAELPLQVRIQAEGIAREYGSIVSKGTACGLHAEVSAVRSAFAGFAMKYGASERQATMLDILVKGPAIVYCEWESESLRAVLVDMAEDLSKR